MTEHAQAPGELLLVQRFLNTVDIESGDDAVASADGLRGWLRKEFADPGALGADDVERALALREAVRDLLSLNAGQPVDASHERVLAAVAVRAPLRVFFESGTALLRPAGTGIDAFLGHLLAVIARSQADGTWPRLKTCHADSCRWAFYDHSRNRSRTWCSMEVCGNRAKARTYRARASTTDD